jgi:hypothetical protein
MPTMQMTDPSVARAVFSENYIACSDAAVQEAGFFFSGHNRKHR